ncbi:unnamed protein product [Haemonchus placei]|uniref:Secreted protein n=1 Tax=Haemonchus placei TaxID=6290 RepID=A0A0N4W5J6_HAEPC|nr:unnamed protein product [Haemonchus placei]
MKRSLDWILSSFLAATACSHESFDVVVYVCPVNIVSGEHLYASHPRSIRETVTHHCSQPVLRCIGRDDDLFRRIVVGEQEVRG